MVLIWGILDHANINVTDEMIKFLYARTISPEQMKEMMS